MKIKRRIIKGNDVTEQIIEREGEGDDAKEEVISEQKGLPLTEVKKPENKEDEIVLSEETSTTNDNGKIIEKVKRVIKKGNKIIEQKIEKDGDGNEISREEIIKEETEPKLLKGDQKEKGGIVEYQPSKKPGVEVEIYI